jgi:hypothetical protein
MVTARGDSPAAKQTAQFTIADSTDYRKLKLLVNAKDAFTVYLNEQVIFRFPAKRKKLMFDEGWKDWEEVTLKPAALTLLRKGPATISIETAGGSALTVSAQSIGVPLQGMQPKAVATTTK